jgi:hypothetical protein
MDSLLPEDRLLAVVGGCTGELLGHAAAVCRSEAGSACFTRPRLHRMLGAASEIEEILDVYGAGRNRRWYPLRRLTATIKLFSGVAYQLQHILLFLPAYRLLPVERDFAAATAQALDVICGILRRSLEALMDAAAGLGLRLHEERGPGAYVETIVRGHLPADRMSEKAASPEETVARVATAFLNLAEDGKFIHVTQEEKPDHYADWIPEPISEARLRDLEQGFHNLQSLYDTHISETNVERVPGGRAPSRRSACT